MIRKFFEPGSFDEAPHDLMRKAIARRLVEASQTIPHFYLSIDCDLDALLALREDDQRQRRAGQGRQARLQDLGQ